MISSCKLAVYSKKCLPLDDKGQSKIHPKMVHLDLLMVLS